MDRMQGRRAVQTGVRVGLTAATVLTLGSLVPTALGYYWVSLGCAVLAFGCIAVVAAVLAGRPAYGE